MIHCPLMMVDSYKTECIVNRKIDKCRKKKKKKIKNPKSKF